MRIPFKPLIGIVTALALITSSAALAQLPKIEDSQLGVDRIELSSGPRIYGFVLQRMPDGGATVAVERAWLQTTHPKLADEWLAAQAASQQTALDELLVRMDEWIAEHANQARFQRFLQLEREQLAEKPAVAVDSLFLTRELAASDIRKLTLQPAHRRQIAGIAYQHRLPNVVLTPTSALLRQLSELKLDPSQEPVDLSADLPAIPTQSPRQWAARQALVEFQMLEPLEYQGTGTQLFRKGAAIDPQALIGQMLGGGGGDAISRLGAELGLPEFKAPAERADWWHGVTAEAERDGFRGVLITRLDQNLLSTKVAVEANFFAREQPGQWFLVRTFRAETDATAQPAEQMERLRTDPQIAALINTLDSLGLGAQAQFDRALQHGAATQVAMQEAQAQFTQFTEQQLRSLAGQPIQLP